MSKELLSWYPESGEDLEMLRTLGHEAVMLGNNEEATRIMKEDIYQVLFQQDQYQRQLYRKLKEFGEENPGEIKEIVDRYLSKLELSIRSRADVLNSWENDIRENLKLLENSNVSQINSEEGK